MAWNHACYLVSFLFINLYYFVSLCNPCIVYNDISPVGAVDVCLEGAGKLTGKSEEC